MWSRAGSTGGIATPLALLAGAGPEGVAHGHGAGRLGLVAQRVLVAVLEREQRRRGDVARLARSAQEAVDHARAAPPLGDRGDDQRLPDARVAAGEHAVLAGRVDG